MQPLASPTVDPIVVSSRFVGPPARGQGGYTAGLVAARLGTPVTVSVWAPIPLDIPMSLRIDGAQTHLERDGVRIATATPRRHSPVAVSPVTPAQAEDARSRYPGLKNNPAPDCFSCGIRGDTFGVHAGPVSGGGGLFATPWIPPDWTAGDMGHVEDPYVWTVLDCSAGWRVSADPVDRPAFTGAIGVDVLVPPRPGRTYVVVAAATGDWDGRKRPGASALYDDSGELVAASESLWISATEQDSNLPIGAVT